MKNSPNLSHATLNWTDGLPHSSDFNDIYFSSHDAIQEARYVFCKGAGLDRDFPMAEPCDPPITIGETGFGSGLNFLTTWQLWEESGRETGFTFISCEAYPLKLSDLEKIHQVFPGLEAKSKKLRDQWPPLTPGIHSLTFSGGKVRLILLLGDAAEQYADLDSKISHWFLDGFAPSRNEDMWSSALFDQIARLSQPCARLATFTAAGFVKRALAARGFQVAKTPGWGRKRERITAVFNQGNHQQHHAIIPDTHKNEHTKPIVIIGGGIAGLTAAHSLAARGKAVRILTYGAHDTTSLAQGNHASAVPAATISPAFTLGAYDREAFIRAAFIKAVQFPPYQAHFMAPRGLKLLPSEKRSLDQLSKIAKSLNWDEDWLKKEIDGLNFPKAGSLNTAALLKELSDDFPIQTGTVTALKQLERGDWRIEFKDQTFDSNEITAQKVVIAAGAGTAQLLPNKLFPDRFTMGSILTIDSGSAVGARNYTYQYGGYITPISGGQRYIGSNFDKYQSLPNQVDDITERHSKEITQLFENTFSAPVKSGDRTLWTGARHTLYDHLPYVGPVPNREAFCKWAAPMGRDAKLVPEEAAPRLGGLYVFAGLGSKGYQYAPLLADVLAAQICGDTPPLSRHMLAAIDPGRYLLRQIIKNRPLPE